MGYFSIEQVAKKTGISKRSLYYRPDIQEMLASTTPEIAHRGLKLYPLSAFPADIKILLMDASAYSQLRTPNSELPYRQLPPAATSEVDVRLQILNRRDTWGEAGKYQNQYEADIAFCKAATAGEIPDFQPLLDQLVWGSMVGLSRASLCRMRQKRRNGQIGELVRTVGHRKRTGAIDIHESLNRFVLGQILTHPQQSIDQLYAKMQDLQFPVMPSLSNVRLWVKTWIAENQDKYLSVTNPDAWRNKKQVAFGSYSEAIYQPNQLWEIDSSPTDTMLTNGRSAEIALVDVYSRRSMTRIFKTSKSEGIMTLIRLAVIEWGIPTAIKSDQGKDYCSEAVTEFCARLGIQLTHCQPYSPWQKPHVERFFGTLNHAQADLPGYIGCDVATREAIRSQHSFADNRRKPNLGAGDRGTISPEQFGCWLDDWTTQYNNRVHSETGKTPNQAFAELDHPNYCEDVGVLNKLMDCAGVRKVGKAGIRWQSYEFVAAELALHVGEQVRIYNDANDLSRLMVYDLQGVLICESICFELRGISTYDVAREASAKQNAAKAKFKKDAAKLKREANKLRPNVESIQAAAKTLDPPRPVGHPSEERCASVGFPDHEGATRQGISPVVEFVKPAKRQRQGEDIFNLLLDAFRDDREMPQDFTDEELHKLRVHLDKQKSSCDALVGIVIESRFDRSRFLNLTTAIAHPQLLAQ